MTFPDSITSQPVFVTKRFAYHEQLDMELDEHLNDYVARDYYAHSIAFVADAAYVVMRLSKEALKAKREAGA